MVDNIYWRRHHTIIKTNTHINIHYKTFKSLFVHSSNMLYGSIIAITQACIVYFIKLKYKKDAVTAWSMLCVAEYQVSWNGRPDLWDGGSAGTSVWDPESQDGACESLKHKFYKYTSCCINWLCLSLLCIKYMLSEHSVAQEIKHLCKFTSGFMGPQISLVPPCKISVGGMKTTYNVVSYYVHLKDATVCNLNSTMKYSSFELFSIYVVFFLVP